MARLLFITHTRIGDCVLSTGLLRHFLEQHPDYRVTVAAGHLSAPMFAELPQLERLIPITKRRANLHWFWLWRQVVGTHWDLVVDLRQSIIPFVVRRRRALILPRNRPQQPMAQHLTQLMDGGGGGQLPLPQLWPAPHHHQAAAQLLAKPIASNRPILALAPSANWPPKQWPLEQFVATARQLTQQLPGLQGATIAIFGAPSEDGYLSRLHQLVEQDAAQHGQPLPILPLWHGGDLLTVYACLQQCQLFIGNDSGLMHMAAAAGIPTLGLFGPTSDHLMAPYGRHTDFVRTPESCEALRQQLAADPALAQQSLMTGLDVPQVVAAAIALYQQAAPEILRASLRASPKKTPQENATRNP
jgi:ADP-heptose:LPS heptosyltransferase